jgi:hypothetical protein
MSQTISVGDLALGTPVIGSDGKKIGVINEVEENPSAPHGSPGSFYFEVNSGGILGIGTTHLYVPVQAVADAHASDGVVLRCTAKEASERYQHQPG